jgi:hypothetical protein
VIIAGDPGNGSLRGNEEGPLAGDVGYLFAMLVLRALLLLSAAVDDAAFLRAIDAMTRDQLGDGDTDDKRIRRAQF